MDQKEQNSEKKVYTDETIGKVVLDLSKYPGEDFYCDGESEEELLKITRDLSTVEYAKTIEEKASWPIFYHLSPQRENIVEWLPISKKDKVLEVGSGCGAITGVLSRKAGSVTCVDLSRKRSKINAYRHSECENVTIKVGNFQDIEPDLDTNFDYICLIGVFEYGISYIGGETPFEDGCAKKSNENKSNPEIPKNSNKNNPKNINNLNTNNRSHTNTSTRSPY